jgi:hypothetical protein
MIVQVWSRLDRSLISSITGSEPVRSKPIMPRRVWLWVSGLFVTYDHRYHSISFFLLHSMLDVLSWFLFSCTWCPIHVCVRYFFVSSTTCPLSYPMLEDAVYKADSLSCSFNCSSVLAVRTIFNGCVQCRIHEDIVHRYKVGKHGLFQKFRIQRAPKLQGILRLE